MSGDRPLDLSTRNECQQCHLLPCRIEYDKQTVKAKEYFWPTIRVLEPGSDIEQGRDSSTAGPSMGVKNPENPILTASFRGRPLQGREVRMPEGYRGYVVDKALQSRGTAATRGFDKFTYWNWDQIPGEEDPVVKAVQWIDISNAIHSDPSH